MLKPGDKYPAMNVLRVSSERATVHYTCCGRTVISRHETIERHIRSGRDKCAQCAAVEKRAKEGKEKADPRRGLYRDQPGAVINEIVRVGRHDWWPMSGGMGR